MDNADLRQGIVDDSGEMMFETGYGEFKSGHHIPDPKKSAPVVRDLVRVGLLMKDELDTAEDLYDVTTHVGFFCKNCNGIKQLQSAFMG